MTITIIWVVLGFSELAAGRRRGARGTDSRAPPLARGPGLQISLGQRAGGEAHAVSSGVGLRLISPYQRHSGEGFPETPRLWHMEQSQGGATSWNLLRTPRGARARTEHPMLDHTLVSLSHLRFPPTSSRRAPGGDVPRTAKPDLRNFALCGRFPACAGSWSLDAGQGE